MALGIPMAMLLGGGIAAGGSVLGGLLGKSKKIKPEDYLVYKELPGYAEADAARGEWWNRLQKWGKQPGYGAISPEWEDIWNLAKKKLTQYYWGGPMDTGLAGKIKASAARRNVSQSPALENMLTAMGMEESSQLSDLASQEAINKAQFSETGRQNWLTSLMNLTQLKPSYVTGMGTVTPEYDMGNMVTDISGGIGNLFSQYAQQQYLTQQQQDQQNWLTDLFKQYSGGTSGSSLSSSFGAARSPNMGLSFLDTSKYPNLFAS